MGIRHRRVIPYWSQSNGLVERFMKPLGKALQTSSVDGIPWKKTLQAFLRNYRAAPHSSTGKPPGDVLFRRSFSTKIPQLSKKAPLNSNEQQADERAKTKMAEQVKKRIKSKSRNLRPGDLVLAQRQTKNKMQSFYDPDPYEITTIKGTCVSATRNSQTITRNASHFRRVSPHVDPSEPTETSSSDIIDMQTDVDDNQHQSKTVNPDIGLRQSTRYDLRQNPAKTQFFSP